MLLTVVFCPLSWPPTPTTTLLRPIHGSTAVEGLVNKLKLFKRTYLLEICFFLLKIP